MLAVQCELADSMVAVVDTPDRVIRGDVNAVRPDEISLAPRLDELAVAVEDDNRVLTPVEHVHVILAVRRYRDDFSITPASRQLFPFRKGFVAELAAADDDAISAW